MQVQSRKCDAYRITVVLIDNLLLCYIARKSRVEMSITRTPPRIIIQSKKNRYEKNFTNCCFRPRQVVADCGEITRRDILRRIKLIKYLYRSTVHCYYVAARAYDDAPFGTCLKQQKRVRLHTYIIHTSIAHSQTLCARVYKSCIMAERFAKD